MSSLSTTGQTENTQMCATKAYVAEFSHKHDWPEAMEKNTNPLVFVQASEWCKVQAVEGEE